MPDTHPATTAPAELQCIADDCTDQLVDLNGELEDLMCPAHRRAMLDDLAAIQRGPVPAGPRMCQQGGDHIEGSRWYTCLGCYAD